MPIRHHHQTALPLTPAPRTKQRQSLLYIPTATHSFMKRTTLLLATLLIAVSVQAQLSGNGYYRVQNVYTSRYVRVIDSYGSIDIASTTADMTAIQTIKKFDNVCSDPASIIYIEKKTVGYNLFCQGTNTYSIIGYYPLISNNGNDTYKAYAENKGMVAYLADEISSSIEGVVVSNSKKSRDWYIFPVSQADNKWFGVKPDINIGNLHALSFFAEFPFTFASPGMQASIVTKIDDKLGAVVYKKWEGEVPGATPVIIRCASADPTNNRLDIHTSTSKAPKENLMKGVYFRNPKNKDTNPHHNVVNNDPATMRILGVTSDGSLGFVQCTDNYLPRNRAWISVSASAPAELKLVTEEEYAEIQPPVIDEEAFSKEYGDGWYHLTNVATGRTLVLQANAATPAASLATLSADDASATSHPGTVFRIASVEGGYTLRSQGVELTTSAGSLFRLWKDDTTGAYTLFSTSDDTDTFIGSSADGLIVNEESSALWQITPVGANFPLSLSASSALPVWTTLCVDFPCTLSEGAKAYIVTALHSGDIPAAILQPLGSQSLPAGTPVLLQCTDKSTMLTIGTVDTTSPSNNLLQGSFLFTTLSTPYYALSTASGAPQLKRHATGTMAHNSAVLPTDETIPETYPLLSQEQYDALVAAAEEEARKEKERILWFAKHCANGWYRLKETNTEEYLTLTTSTVEGLGTSKEVKADAGSIFRIDASSDGIICLRCQGVDVSALLGGNVRMRHNDDDSYTLPGLEGTWKVVNVKEYDWFPELPFFTQDSKTLLACYWGTVCTDFPYTLSESLAAYVVSATHDTVAATVWERYDSYQIPAGMPVLLCWITNINTPAIFTITDVDAQAPTGNLLHGTLLSTSATEAFHTLSANNDTLAFLRTNASIHPANSVWLSTSPGLADWLPLMTAEEYEDALLPQSIVPIIVDDEEQLFCTPSGIVIRSTMGALPSGIYISKGHKIIIR